MYAADVIISRRYFQDENIRRIGVNHALAAIKWTTCIAFDMNQHFLLSLSSLCVLDNLYFKHMYINIYKKLQCQACNKCFYLTYT